MTSPLSNWRTIALAWLALLAYPLLRLHDPNRPGKRRERVHDGEGARGSHRRALSRLDAPMSGHPTPFPYYRDALEQVRAVERTAARFTRRSGRVLPGVTRTTINALAAGINEGLSYEQVALGTGRIAETHGALPVARRSR